MTLLKVLLFVSIVIVCFLSFLIHPEHEPHYIWEKIPVFEAIFGFVGCIVLIIFSKVLGHYFLEKQENYYDYD